VLILDWAGKARVFVHVTFFLSILIILVKCRSLPTEWNALQHPSKVLGTMTLSTKTIFLNNNDTQHDDTQHNETQHNNTQHNYTQHNDTQ
jgi:hypothetical protein